MCVCVCVCCFVLFCFVFHRAVGISRSVVVQARVGAKCRTDLFCVCVCKQKETK